jgi:hypothetical protein
VGGAGEWRREGAAGPPPLAARAQRSRPPRRGRGLTLPVRAWASAQEGGRVVVLPANLTEPRLRELLKPYLQYKIWHLKDPEAFFGGFENRT